MSKQKLNIAIGRFQPFTQGHLNMVNEGEGPCIVYRINSSNKTIERKKKGIKIGSKSWTDESVNKVISYIDNPTGDLTEQEKELLKRPFTNELIDKELESVKKANKNIIDVIPVTHVYDALGRFNAYLTEHSDEYEPGYWMCGDDRKADFEDNIEKMSKYTDLETEFKSGKTYPNILIGKLKVNTGKGRTAGVSGTAVRKAILNKDKAAFEKIMPKGAGAIFNDFVKAFDEFKAQLQNIIKEHKMMSLKEYISESLDSFNKDIIYINESYRFSNYILYGNVKKELRDIYDFNVRRNEDNEAQDKLDEIVKCINDNTDNFVKNVGKENITYVKYNTLFPCWDFAKSLSNTDIPIIKSKFIENNYNYYANFPMHYAFSVLGPWQSDSCELFSCKFNDFTNILKKFNNKYNKDLWYVDMFFDINEYNFPQDEDEFKELYKDLTGSPRFPSQMNVDFDQAHWEKYDVFVGRKSKAKLKPIVFRKPAGTFIKKFIIPFIEKYTINFIYLYIESYSEKINFMYDKSNDIVYYTW